MVFRSQESHGRGAGGGRRSKPATSATIWCGLFASYCTATYHDPPPHRRAWRRDRTGLRGHRQAGRAWAFLARQFRSFIADLCANWTWPVEVDFLEASSYGNGWKARARCRILKTCAARSPAATCWLVEDYLDTGHTLHHVVKPAALQGARAAAHHRPAGQADAARGRNQGPTGPLRDPRTIRRRLRHRLRSNGKPQPAHIERCAWLDAKGPDATVPDADCFLWVRNPPFARTADRHSRVIVGHRHRLRGDRWVFGWPDWLTAERVPRGPRLTRALTAAIGAHVPCGLSQNRQLTQREHPLPSHASDHCHPPGSQHMTTRTIFASYRRPCRDGNRHRRHRAGAAPRPFRPGRANSR